MLSFRRYKPDQVQRDCLTHSDDLSTPEIMRINAMDRCAPRSEFSHCSGSLMPIQRSWLPAASRIKRAFIAYATTFQSKVMHRCG